MYSSRIAEKKESKYVNSFRQKGKVLSNENIEIKVYADYLNDICIYIPQVDVVKKLGQWGVISDVFFVTLIMVQNEDVRCQYPHGALEFKLNNE
ncbi:hypothetical protein TNCV_1416681 [Trichonephila clavipes]|nr:hypothetical protein TNCV_1416681 [Trichonephila clavipes]